LLGPESAEDQSPDRANAVERLGEVFLSFFGDDRAGPGIAVRDPGR
jgi:hypothetical protein